MIIEIALGIILALVILAFLPVILVAGFWVLVAAAAIGALLVLAYNPELGMS